jgi:alkylresorcinol/alkylpyrone synthase
MGMVGSVALIGLATATPPHVLWQGDVAASARQMFAGYPEFARMAPVFETAGIRKRHSVQPLEWFFTPQGWPERTAAYIDGARRLFIDAATGALDEAGLSASDIDTVVTVSSTGIATPSIEAHAAEEMGFRADILRVPIFGLGCAGGVSGFSIAARLAQSRPGSAVLFVTVELCTLAFRLDTLTKANMVATALFGDGAAACVLTTGAEGGLAEVEASGEHLWPKTLDIMGWNVDPQGFGVIFAQAIPPFAAANIGPAVLSILGRAGLEQTDIDRFICHPGGAKVIAALERGLALPLGSLDDERAVLADYGNMSAPTVFFVLDRARRAGLPNRSAMLAMGPGFTVGCVTLRRVA